jgi:hypothetical protein
MCSERISYNMNRHQSVALAYHQTRETASKTPWTIPITDVQQCHAVLSSNEAVASYILSNENSIFLCHTGESPKLDRLVKPTSALVKQVTVWRGALVLLEDGQAYSLDSDGVFEKIEGGPYDFVCSGYSYSYLKSGRTIYRCSGTEVTAMQTIPEVADTPIKMDAGYDQVILLTREYKCI